MVPSKFNNSGPNLALLDTGAVEELADENSARQFAKFDNPPTYKIRCVSGEVKNVCRAADVIMQIPGLTRRLNSVIAIDMDKLGRDFGVHTTGILGFETLHMLGVKIDYRDGLVQFGYDPMRWGMK